MSRPRLLVVDDEGVVRRSLSRFFSLDFDVDTAADGREALLLIKKGWYDVIVSDLNMPRMNGQLLLERLRLEYPEMVNRFVFHTGDPEDIKNHSVVVDKGSGPDVLLSVVRETLGVD